MHDTSRLENSAGPMRTSSPSQRQERTVVHARHFQAIPPLILLMSILGLMMCGVLFTGGCTALLPVRSHHHQPSSDRLQKLRRPRAVKSSKRRVLVESPHRAQPGQKEIEATTPKEAKKPWPQPQSCTGAFEA